MHARNYYIHNFSQDPLEDELQVQHSVVDNASDCCVDTHDVPLGQCCMYSTRAFDNMNFVAECNHDSWVVVFAEMGIAVVELVAAGLVMVAVVEDIYVEIAVGLK
mmetsp:Transcript_16499/g.31071  ORF Transcript_16499/g.31071 Transcript_16499/m.31071 type:complete len:105 (+) Transcript_16499:708-1022(+)